MTRYTFVYLLVSSVFAQRDEFRIGTERAVVEAFKMLQQQVQVCSLFALVLFSQNTGSANAKEEKNVSVSTKWHPIRYDNNNIESATLTIIHETGIRRRESNTNTRTLTATQNIGGAIKAGDLFEIVDLSFSFSFTLSFTQADMSESDVYTSRKIETRVTVPPRSTLIRWELIADVAGTEVHGKHYIDVFNDTLSTPHTYTSFAKVLIRRPIHYGHTRVRLKSFENDKYMTVIERHRWPAATLGYSRRFQFILCNNTRGIGIKSLYTMHHGYEWAYASYSGRIYFDLKRYPECRKIVTKCARDSFAPICWEEEVKCHNMYDSDIDKQNWIISENEPHGDGDVVTFRNIYYGDNYLSYYQGDKADVFRGVERRWRLETVAESDFPENQC